MWKVLRTATLLLLLLGGAAGAWAQDDFSPDNPAEPHALFRVTLTCTPEGVANLEGEGRYAVGSTAYIHTWTDNENYRFVCWKRNGVIWSQEAEMEYETEATNVTFEAVYEDANNPFDPNTPFVPDNPEEPFAHLMYTLYVDCDYNDICRVEGTENGKKYDAGTTFDLNAVSESEDYVFEGWYQGEELMCENASFSFTMPERDVRINAKFAYDPVIFSPDSPIEPDAVQTDVDNFFMLGDVNHDNMVDVADFIAVANYILNNPLKIFVKKAANVHEDEEIDVADFIGIAKLILESPSNANRYQTGNSKQSISTISPTDIDALDNAIYISPVTAQAGKQQVLSVCMKNTEKVAGYEFSLQLPEGITVATDEDGMVLAELSTERTTPQKTNSFGAKIQPDGTLKVLCGTYAADEQGELYTFSGNDGEVALITIDIPEDYDLGEYAINILNGKLADEKANKTTLQPCITSILTVEAPSLTVLDENDPNLPTATDAATDIKVMRTINANEWSTLCLPFDMTKEQVYAAFGDDVLLAEFTNYEVEESSGKITGIQVNFTSSNLDRDGFIANYPYIIKTSSPITEFTVNAKIIPDEAGAKSEYAQGRGANREVYGTFYGTLHSGTTIPANSLFLYDNKFYYSAGRTTIKAFRGYFTFVDILDDKENANTITYTMDETNGVRQISSENGIHTGVYDLQGRRMMTGTPWKKGIYIIGGKKRVIK